MGYTITIGDAVPGKMTWEDYDGHITVPIDVEVISSKDAPAFPYDIITANTNVRSPSYCGWAEFLADVNLYELFMGEETGLMRRHPGVFKLKQKHLDAINEAISKYLIKNPNAIPGCNFDPNFALKSEKDDGIRGRNYNLARLLWLRFWFDYALKNCKVPAIKNT